MRIAQVAPLSESVPPRGYGGIERVVHYLTEELVCQGHEVTLFASGDSHTKGKHIAVVPESLRQAKSQRDHHMCHMLQLAQVAKMAAEFDIVHFHTDVSQYALWRHINTPHLTTLHGRLDIPDLVELFKEFNDTPVISISNSQRQPMPLARWVRTVYNGIPLDEFTLNEEKGEYFAFLGRIAPEKGPERAIEIAKRAGVPLKMAAKVDPVDRDYFATRIAPLLKDPAIEYIGEVSGSEKVEFLRNARALLFPIDWPEPFGLVMAEAMACGTPVIAFNRGSVPEVMKDGITGFVVESVDEAVEAISKLDTIERKQCRQHCADNFSVAAMTSGYLNAYEELTQAKVPPPRAHRWNGSSVPLETPHVSGGADGRPPVTSNGFSKGSLASPKTSPPRSRTQG